MGTLVLIKGAGDLASGIALRLHRAKFSVAMTELSQPTSIRRTVCFSEAVIKGATTVEGVEGVLAQNIEEAVIALWHGKIPVMPDPKCETAIMLNPDAIVDAILAKKNTGTKITDAPIVIGVGPGFTAGKDCCAVVETQRGHWLGRVITKGGAAPNTGIPGNIGGYTTERVLRAPVKGIFTPAVNIGDVVSAGDIAADVDGQPVYCAIDGVLRGILPGNTPVHKGMKCGDVDPRCEREHCFTVSDKALSVAGGVLEALLMLSEG